MHRMFLPLVVAVLSTSSAAAQYESWSHRATIVLLTTPDGADLPETAREVNFPVLVRLHRDTFPFAQAKADGGDVRFSVEGKPLAYQIESWDARGGAAAVWVLVPEIRGNARQPITVHWGRGDAVDESNGQAVFNERNGHAAVLHLNEADDALRDELDTVRAKNAGTTIVDGLIGRGRRFQPGQGIACGTEIANLPSGAGPCTTEAWVRAEQVNGTVVGWGNEQAQGKVVMKIESPPHVKMDCYFSGANAGSTSRLAMSQWVHVVHAYREGEARLYVDGRLEAVTSGRQTPLNIRSPARMWLGGWYGRYDFDGAIDEVRISRVMRSADWIKLAYENQKPQQTLVGTPVRPGTTLTLSPEVAAVDEGRSITLTAEAGGAEKVSWIVHRNGVESVVAVDSLTYTFEAGRVTGDQACVVRFKAVYPNEVRTKEARLSVRDSIPEPSHELQAPKTWNGRDPIEVVPLVRNREAMQAAGSGELRYRWEVSGGAVLQQTASDRLILKRSQFTGPIRIACKLDNGGEAVERSTMIDVAEPPKDSWVARTPEADERPEDGQFYARDDRNEGTLYCNGTLTEPADEAYLKVFADERPYASEKRKPSADRHYAFAVKLKPGLIRYRVEFGTIVSGKEKLLHAAGNLVCGDAYLIDGQSNALATDTREESPRETHEWVRSYGGPAGRGDGNDWLRSRQKAAEEAGLSRPNLWCNPVWKANRPEHAAELGWWGMELAKQLVHDHQVPIFILNSAVGGTRIDEHQPADADRTDLRTMYGRMLWRLRQARLTHGIRAVVWHQGESDQGAQGPSGGYGWEAYHRYFITLAAAWKEDLPNVRHYYTFQIWPNACSMGGSLGSGDRLREAQRTLPRLFSNMSILSTLGIQPPGSCHYPLEGWSEFARMLQPQIDRDFYGRAPTKSITPPDLRRAYFAEEARSTLVLEFDQEVEWNPAAAEQIFLDDQVGEVAEGRAAGKTLVLTLKQPSTAARVTYLKERNWKPEQILRGANGIAALTFCDVEILPPAKR